MAGSLFRKEAIDAKSRSYFGKVTLVSPVSHSVTSSLLLLIGVAIILFLVFGSYSRKETVAGYVTTTEGNVKVYPQSSGTIQAVYVGEGQPVERGQALFSLSTARASNRSIANGRQVIASLRHEEQALNTQIDREKQSFATREDSINAEIATLTRRLQLSLEQQQLSSKWQDIAKKDVDRLSALSKSDYVSMADKDAAAAALLAAQIRRKEAELNVDTIQSDLSRQRQNLAELPNQRAMRLAELQRESARLTQKMVDGEAREQQLIVATSSGRVSGLTARQGQTVSPAQPVLSLVPGDSTYYVELLVPSRSIGFINTETDVRMRFDAFPHQKFGTVGGRVEHVARTVFVPGELVFPVPITESAYLVTVSLERQYVDAYGKQQALQAGMTLSADILRDRRRLIEWVFDPLISTARRL